VRNATLIIRRGRSQKFTVLKAPRQCPLVLLEKVTWQQGTLGNGVGNVNGSELLG
jgi:hypothetical protein